MRKETRFAFTLIELLVVITIIVVLLALLVPAMDKAIYQAELTVCGARLKSTATSVVTYAAGSKRRYPDRMDGPPGAISPNQIMARVGTSTTATWYVDARPILRPYIGINAALNCPLSGEVDLDNNNPNENVIYSPYDLWFGYQFTNDPTGSAAGMFKLGDRWSWQGRRFDILVSDFVATDSQSPQFGYGSHPDRDGVWSNSVINGGPNPFMADGATPVTATLSWWNGVVPRGWVDLNFAPDDGSVVRFTEVLWENEKRMAEDIPSFGDGYNTSATRLRKVPAAR